MSAYNHIVGFEISMEEITDVVKKGRLLSMEMEFSRHCNFRCPYCYVPQKPSFKDELSVETIQDVILQAKGLGAKRIIILGGEPSIYPHILDMIRFIRENNLEVEMFTNGSGVTPEFAENLISENVRVVLKFNTLDAGLQDKLAGKKGASKIINGALANLVQAGYPSDDAFLAVSTIICRQNLDELPEMWKWLRDRNIVPYFEMITPQGDAKQNKWLEVSALEVKDLFTRLAAIDSEKYGLKWEPQP
ncbi:MAG: radical SAM protein, partial [Desulfobacterales bacterium]|nr:radical SAM protein [Desulfobacterales bacterium]